MNDNRGALLFTWPWLVGLIFLTIIPLGVSLMLSFTQWDGFSEADIKWVGADNYRQMFTGDRPANPSDPRYLKSIYNTLFYTFFAVPLGLIVSLLLAILLNQRLKGIAFFRSVYYLPHLLGGVGTILLWQWLFNPDVGLINTALQGVHHLWVLVADLFGTEIEAWKIPRWLHSPQWCKPALILMHLWGAGGTMLIFLAALQNVPERLYEAARIEGASRWHQFRYITLPHISPAVLFNVVVGLIGAMRVFKDAYLLRHWSQDEGLLFYMLYLYENAFEAPSRLGFASAMAWVMFAALFGLTLIMVVCSRRWVYYET